MISALHPPITPNTPRDRLKHRLEMQSFLIEDVLRRHTAEPVTVTGGHAGARALRYDIPAGYAALPLQTIEQELNRRLGTAVQLQQDAHGLTVSVRHKDPPVGLPHLIALHATPARRPYMALLGVDARQQPVELDLRGSGHILISGDSGSGKSSLLQTLVTTAAAATRAGRLQFLLVRDGRDAKLDVLNYLPAIYYRQRVISHPQEAARALAAAQEFAADRQRLVVVIDNADRVLRTGRIGVLAPLTQLLLSRAVTVVLATRDGRSELFHSLGDAFGTHIVGRQGGADRVGRSATDAPRTLAKHQFLGEGDFVLVQQQRYFQAAYADPYDLSYILARLQMQ